jgi:hypothetical protein
MTRIAATAFVLISLGSSSALAQLAAERAACTADYEKFCKGTIPGGGRIINCLAKHEATLSDACKKVVEMEQKKGL